MMFPCVFAASHTARALFFSAGSLLGTFQAGFSLFFGVLDQFFVSRRPALLIFCIVDPQGHSTCASWRRQTTKSEANGVTKSIFPPPRGSFFGELFGICLYFSEFCDFVKIELPCRRELGFEGSGRSKCHFFLPWNPFQKSERIWRLIGGGGPRGKT